VKGKWRARLRRIVRPVLELPVLFALLGVLLATIIWGATFYVIRLDGRSAVRLAGESVLELIDTYQAQMMANLAAIDQTLKTVKYAFELRGGHEALLELQEKGLLPPDFVFSVGIADARGAIIASTRPGAYSSIAQAPYFLSHRKSEKGGPLATAIRMPGMPAQMLFSRRLNLADGSFGGIVMVTVAADYFTSGYERARAGDHGLLALLAADGSLITARSGDTIWEDTGRRADLQVLAGGDDVHSSPWDGVPRFFQTRFLFGYPLAIMVGLAEHEQLAAFEERRRTHLWQAAVATVVFGMLLFVLGRLSWQLMATRLHTRKEQEIYYAATNASLDGFFILKSLRGRDGKIIDFRAVDANLSGAQLLGVSKADIIGATLAAVFPQVHADGTFAEFVRVAESGAPAEKEWENTSSWPRARWLYRQVLRVEGDLVVMLRDITERKQAELLRAEQGRVLEMIATGVPLEDVLGSLMLLVETQFGGMKCSVLLLDADGRRLRHGAALSLPPAYVRAIDGIEIGPRVGSCGTAAYRKQPVIAGDILNDPLWEEYRDLAVAHGLRACWSVPILSRDEDVVGTFALYSPRPQLPDPAQMQLLDMVARIAGIAIERKRTEDRIRHMAHHDALTGLPNRTLLDDRLHQAILYAKRDRNQVAVVFVDLDNFKLINDSLGHNAGDLLLKTVAERMLRCVRGTDTVVRLGGDEFVIVLADQTSGPDAVTPTLEKLLQVIGAPMTIDGHALQIGASLGIATYPADGGSPEMLLMNADAAMYRAKDLGRNNYQFYTAEMNIRVQQKLDMQEGLRNALARDEFFLLYQPQVDMHSGRIFGAEALIRWQHPHRGLIAPTQFIPAAEECGLIVPIGDWVLREACRQNKAWQTAGLPPFVVAVNVSARQFKDRNLVDKVRRALQESGLAPHCLELELTESLIMQDLQQAVATMRELQAMGVQLSIDDFGTGYSSLSALKNFPITRLKLDRSFVRDLPAREGDAAIATAIISLGHKLNLKVLAEGVETEAQLEFLRAHECDELQGYYFSKPLPPEEIAALVAGQAAARPGPPDWGCGIRVPVLAET